MISEIDNSEQVYDGGYGFLMDMQQISLCFGPRLMWGNGENLVSFGRAGPETRNPDQFVSLVSRAQMHEEYGSPSEHWMSGYALDAMLQVSTYAIGTFQSTQLDLMEAVRDFLWLYPEYKYHRELSKTLENLGTFQYLRVDAEPAQETNWQNSIRNLQIDQFSSDKIIVIGSTCGGASSFAQGLVRNHLQRFDYPSPSVRTLSKKNDVLNIGRSPNARKRW